MAKDRFLIAPFEIGLQTDVRPWLIPDQAFSVLENAYVFRGRVEKRPGAIFQNTAVPLGEQINYSRLALSLGNTDAAGVFNAGGAANIPGNVAKVGQMFSVGNAIITVTALGAPATIITNTASAGAPATLVNMTAAPGNMIQFNFGVAYALLPVYYYPAEPVMGLDQLQILGVNNEETFGFDTQFGYRYINGHWELAGAAPSLWGVAQPAGSAMWTSSNSQFMWSVNYRGPNPNDRAIYATNNKALGAVTLYDGVKVYNNTTLTWANLTPAINAAGDTIVAALCIEVFKEALFLFNVVIRSAGPVDNRYGNRIQFSVFGANPAAATSFRIDQNNTAGQIFLPTEEEITSVTKIKDRLIVYCDRSTWEIVYTGNPSNRFIVQKINSELGVESTFSPAIFDRATLGVGQVGITACSGTNIERIDEKIPDQVFQIRNLDDGPIRVHGIRDYFNECVYWTFPSTDAPDSYPDSVLLYNYRNGSYAVLDDSITTYGYDQNIQNIRWQDLQINWEDVDRRWDDPTFAGRFLPVLAGNQQGVCFKIINDVPRNEAVQYITNLDFSVLGQVTVTSINHNNIAGSFIEIVNCQGANLGTFNDALYEVRQVLSVNQFVVSYVTVGGETYTGGGNTRRLSRIYIQSKQFNLYQKDGFDFALEKIEFNVDRQAAPTAKIAVGYNCNTNYLNQVNIPGTVQFQSNIILTPYTIYPWENGADNFWRTLYANVHGTYVQFAIAHTDEQMVNRDAIFSDFSLNAIMLHTSPTSARFQ